MRLVARHAARQVRHLDGSRLRLWKPELQRLANELGASIEVHHLPPGTIVPPNITLVALPAECPEFNHQKNVWQFMRENWLSNRAFRSFDDIVGHVAKSTARLLMLR